MARVGDVIENPAMGARLAFRRVAADTGGSILEFDFFLGPGGVIAVDHVHPHQEERFEVVAGAVRGTVGAEPHVVPRGGTSVVPAGVPHGWWNASDDEPAHLRVQFRPALRTEELFEKVFALARAGRTDATGVPRFPERFTVLAAFPDEVRPAAMPLLAHRALVRGLAPFGRRLRQSA